MKRILCAVALLTATLTASCVEINTIRGNGVTAEKTIAFASDYTEVNVSNGIKVILSPSLTDRAELVADEAIMEYLSVTQTAGVVKVSYRPSVSVSPKIKTVVTLPLSSRISALKVSSAATLSADEIETPVPISADCSSAGVIEARIVAPMVDVDLSSSARYVGEVAAREVSVELSSAASCTLAGECEELDVDASSASHFKGAELQAAKVSVDASSAAKVTVWSTDELAVDLSSGASVRYKGLPQLILTDISSGASLKKID